MLATISVDENSLGSVIHDLNSARGGQIISLDDDDDDDDDSSPSDSSTSPTSSETMNEIQTIDPRRIYTPPDPFGSTGTSVDGDANSSSPNGSRQIKARVPLKEMVGYLKHLRSLTGGRGTFVMSVDRFERMSAQRMKVVVAEMRGDDVI